MIRLIIIILAISLISCTRERELEINFPFKEKLVIYGYLGNSTGSEINIYNSAPVSAINPDYKNLNTNVYLFEGNSVVDTITKIDVSNFRSDFNLKEDIGYRILVENGGKEYKSDLVYLPDPNPIKYFSYTIDSIENKILLKLTYTDVIENYNELEIFTNLGSIDTILKYDLESGDSSNEIYLRFDYKIPIIDKNHQIIDIANIEKIKLVSTVYSIEKSKFDEFRSNVSSQAGFGNDNGNNLYTNIEGCFGFVCGYVSESLEITF